LSIAFQLDLPFSDELVDLYVALSLLHEASLVHDDLIDRATTRRGSASVFGFNGAEKALIFGDYLFSCQELFLSKVKSFEILELFALCKQTMCEGEFFELSQKNNPDFSLDKYFFLADRKTVSLFSLIGKSLLALSSSKGLVFNSFYEDMAICLGRVYQIFNDCSDYIQIDQQPVFQDFLNKTVNYPVAKLWETGSNHDRTKIKRLFCKTNMTSAKQLFYLLKKQEAFKESYVFSKKTIDLTLDNVQKHNKIERKNFILNFFYFFQKNIFDNNSVWTELCS
jgi:geranylgeranyl pyrophosphate synthase